MNSARLFDNLLSYGMIAGGVALIGVSCYNIGVASQNTENAATKQKISALVRMAFGVGITIMGISLSRQVAAIEFVKSLELDSLYAKIHDLATGGIKNLPG